MKHLSKLALVALLALLTLSLSCGGGGSSGPLPPPPPPPPAPSPLSISTPSLADGIVGNSYSMQIQATGGTPPYAWSLLAQSLPLPNGLTLSPSGLLSGIPNETVNHGIAFQVRDTASQTAAASIMLVVVDRLAITTISLPYGIVSRVYGQTLSTTGGKLPFTWSLLPGSTLPPGVNMVASGGLFGLMTTPGSYSFTVQLADSAGQTSSKSLTVDVFSGPLISKPVAFLTSITGQPFSYTFQATAGMAPYTWDVPSNPYGGPNSLPTGFTLSPDGVFSGTAVNYYGSWSFWVRATDAAGHADLEVFSLNTVLPLTLGPASFPNGNVGVYYSQQLPISGGVGPLTFSLAAGSGPLPPGVNLGGFATIFGTPTAPGTFDFTIEVRDSLGEVATHSYSILIKNDIIITTWNMPYGVVNQPFSQLSFDAVGGTPPYTWSVAAGAFPPGLILDPATSQVSGVPNTAGNFSFDIQAADSANPPQFGTKPFAILIRPLLNILTTTLPDAAVNSSYSATIQADGGSLPPYQARITSGSLPAGINLGTTSDYSGYVYLHGFPSAAGVSNFTVEISDSSSPPATVARDFSIRTDPQLRIDQGTSSFPTILEGQSFTYTFTATGGFPPYIWSVRYAPPGMALDSASGVFSGAPTQRLLGGVFADVQDSANPPQHASQLFFWRVLELLRIRTSQFPPLSVGVPVRMYPSLTGEACCSYSWSVASGSLPTGLSLTDPVNGGIAGTPTAAGTFNFSLQVKDTGTGSLAQSVTKSLSIVVKAQGQLGRNDSISTATPLSNGVYLASISPADDGFGALHPDNDYYALSADPGAIVIVETYADQQLPPGSSMDSVVEILDATGVRHATCNIYAANYTLPCMNDDQYSGNVNSKLYFHVPGAPGDPPVTFYVRVLDWSGMARPDFLYTITITGAN